MRPDTLALLQAFVARHPAPNRQTLMLAELRLRRDLAIYDPEAALRPFEQGMAYGRYADILSDGDHLRPDYRRAVAPILRLDMFKGDDEDERALLRVVRRASAAARTREERAQALRILFAAALQDIDGSCTLVAEQLRPFRDVPVVPIAAGESERISSELSPDFAPALVSDEPRQPRPIVLRPLIDPLGPGRLRPAAPVERRARPGPGSRRGVGRPCRGSRPVGHVARPFRLGRSAADPADAGDDPGAGAGRAGPARLLLSVVA